MSISIFGMASRIFNKLPSAILKLDDSIEFKKTLYTYVFSIKGLLHNSRILKWHLFLVPIGLN
jgi:hypothetical protein